MTRIETHEAAITYLKEIDKAVKQIEDFNIRLTNERAKPLIMSFLGANEKWYLDQIEDAVNRVKQFEQEYKDICLNLMTCL